MVVMYAPKMGDMYMYSVFWKKERTDSYPSTRFDTQYVSFHDPNV